MLRCLNAHSQLRAVHNLSQDDKPHEERLFRFLKTYRRKSIRRGHALLAPYSLSRDEHLLLKQGVWRHPRPFEGFVLARNPVAVYASLREVGRREAAEEGGEAWQSVEARLKRWIRDIDPSAERRLCGLTPTQQFSLFYNTRMGQLCELALPLVHYENFVQDPTATLTRISQVLGLAFESQMVHSHECHGSAREGHGGNSLSSPIGVESLSKYRTGITEGEFDEIVAATMAVTTSLGYSMKWGTSCLPVNSTPVLRTEKTRGCV